MNHSIPSSTESSYLTKNRSAGKKLSTWQIVLLIIACAAPLGSMMGNVPVGLILGNGAGLPAAYLIAGIILLCFAAGYTALIKEFPGNGAFYLYIRSVFGGKVGMGAAFVALLSYVALTASLAAGVGYFSDLVFAGHGIALGWKAWALIGFIIVTVLSQMSADIGAKVLVLIVLSEFLILFIFDATTTIKATSSVLPMASFSPKVVLGSGLGVSLMIAFTSFIGFESAAIYSAEAKDPMRSVPRATVIAVALISLFYLVTSWIIIGAIGVDNVVKTATDLQGDLVAEIIRRQCGSLLSSIAGLMLCASIFACYLSLQNTASRYVVVISQQGFLPEYFNKLNTRFGSPSRASALVSVVVALCLIVPAIQGASPFLVLIPSTAALATLGIILLQALVAAAIVVHFRRKKTGRFARTFVAPFLALIGLTAAGYLIVDNYSILTGVTSGISNYLPVLIVLFFLYGWLIKVPDNGAVFDSRV